MGDQGRKGVFGNGIAIRRQSQILFDSEWKNKRLTNGFIYSSNTMSCPPPSRAIPTFLIYRVTYTFRREITSPVKSIT